MPLCWWLLRTPTFSHQATALGVQRVRRRNSRQRRVPLCSWQGGSQPGTHPRSRAEGQLQSRSQESVQKHRDLGQHPAGTTPRFLPRPSRERDAAHHGRSRSGQQDRRHHTNHLKERGGLRRQPIRSASSLSISGKSVSHLWWFASGGRPGSGEARFEGEYQSMSWAASASAASHPFSRYAPSDNQK